ncbi:hypothetical protein PUNSTDRAFT_108231 [Punctularia strigosozonata HHB-11173 SS5]|uniref:DUF92-domain-containing protein n=1 Tax=Punctularia strigosozonata (strain HHB-11173) TaxID=741275 RepID=R7S3M9_PUNST|nr:uncharacterized protein PUNSTDRAFT_108231 [Punctularia strigosozonata HHB-11173 SS5]EIN04469.1 hypothetical protein PUNSTDRAFT_108231 [Punctularia strigosozonata HHB-11173 SS5]
MSVPSHLYLPFGIASLLSLHGLRKRSLSPSGAFAAFLVGFLTFAPPLRAFGTSLIVFYLVGSRATKVGKALKRSYEEGYEDAGYRDWMQVLCNSGSALVCATVWASSFAPGWLGGLSDPLGRVIGVKPGKVAYKPEEWCPVSSDVANGLSRALLFGTLGHFACCLGDTLASELGILSKSRPRLVTTFKALLFHPSVPPGTNGAMSTMGTLASVAGGSIMGLTLLASMLIEVPACRRGWTTHATQLLTWGFLAGGLGSLMDSFLGATVQRTRYSKSLNKILSDHSKLAKTSSDDVKVVSGIGLLTNNQVNLVSSLLTSLVLAKLA